LLFNLFKTLINEDNLEFLGILIYDNKNLASLRIEIPHMEHLSVTAVAEYQFNSDRWRIAVQPMIGIADRCESENDCGRTRRVKADKGGRNMKEDRTVRGARRILN